MTSFREKELVDFVKSVSEKYKDLGEKWYQDQRDKYNAYLRENRKRANWQATYRAKFGDLRSMKNLSQHEKDLIRIFYENTPEGHEVDHIIPLSKGGKHHIKNLQYLPVYQNRKKKNHIDFQYISKSRYLLFSWYKICFFRFIKKFFKSH